MEGQSITYYESGTVQEESEYKNGLKSGESKWYDKDHKPIAVYHYKDGMFDGLNQTFYTNGNINLEQNYSANVLNGEYKEYYPTGKIKVSGNYLDGKKDGTWTENDPHGTVLKQTDFVGGRKKRSERMVSRKKKINNPYTRLEGYNCFGCSPFNEMGLKMEFFEEGDFVLCEWKPSSNFGGYKNVLHGGIQATLLDEIASWTVQVKLKTAGVTAGIDIRLRKPVFTYENKIMIKANVQNLEKRIAFIQTWLYNSKEELCADGIVKYFVYPEEIAREKLYYPEFEKFFKK